MKKYLIAFFAATLLFASCKSPDSVVPPVATTLAGANVPAPVLASMSRNFPTAAEVIWRQTAPTAYMATFKQGSSARTATFQETGALLKAGEVINSTTLPAAITAYLAANHPGYVIVQADVKKTVAGVVREYEVLIMVNNVQYELEFDGTGVFKELETSDGHRQENAIAASALPAAITNYLTANYPGYVFREAESRAANGVLVGYEVEIVLNNTEFELYFDAAGVFLRLDSERNDKDDDDWDDDDKYSAIAQSALPAAVTTYLTTNYAGYTFVSAEVEKNKAGVVIGYEVEFTLGGKKYEADFNAAGVFLRMD